MNCPKCGEAMVFIKRKAPDYSYHQCPSCGAVCKEETYGSHVFPRDLPKTNDVWEDLPADELMREASARIQEGFLVFFKYTCEKCGLRQFMGEEPNTIYEYVTCEKCGHNTHITKGGFAVLWVRNHSHESIMTE